MQVWSNDRYPAPLHRVRANADRYHIDSDRIGAWGFSAGGWLSSSGAFTDSGDLYVGNKNAVSEAWPLDDERGKQLLAKATRPRRGELVPGAERACPIEARGDP